MVPFKFGSFMSKSISLLILSVITAFLSISGASQPPSIRELVPMVNPASVPVWHPGQPMALLGDGDMPLSIMGLESSDKTPLLAQVGLSLKKEYRQTTEWTGISRLVRTPPTK